MPMRIVNLKGGGPGPAPSGGASDSGLYKFLFANNFTNTGPQSTKFIEIWESGNKSKPRPDSITVMMWGQCAWHKNGTINSSRPPDCGSAFGIVTLKGDNIPEKLYAWRGSHQSYPYTYTKDTTFGFNSTPSRDDAWLLPNMTGSFKFTNTDFIAPDAVNNHWGDFDAVYNGGNGHFFSSSSGDTHDSPGSNGSPFGTGKASTTQYPASCGGSGTTSARGPKAKGIGSDILKPLGSLRPHASELEPPTARANYDGGNGGFEFILPSDSFGMARGVPYTPDVTIVRVDGGQYPRNRLFPYASSNYSPHLYILFEYAK